MQPLMALANQILYDSTQSVCVIKPSSPGSLCASCIIKSKLTNRFCIKKYLAHWLLILYLFHNFNDIRFVSDGRVTTSSRTCVFLTFHIFILTNPGTGSERKTAACKSLARKTETEGIGIWRAIKTNRLRMLLHSKRIKFASVPLL